MSKSEKKFLFFCIFTITLMFGRLSDFSAREQELSTMDIILILVCYAITLYGSLGIVAYNVGQIIIEKFSKTFYKK